MYQYEIWNLYQSNKIANLIHHVTAVDSLEAIRSYFRFSQKTFYNLFWKDNHSIYVRYGSEEGSDTKIPVGLFLVFLVDESYETKLLNLKMSYDLYLSPSVKKTCDCGSERVFGKGTTHSHWCSANEVRAHG